MKPQTSELQLHDDRKEITVSGMIQRLIESGNAEQNVAALEKLVGLYERQEERNAEKEFARAFNALQADMPSIEASKAVPNNDGTVRYMFAPYEAIIAAVRPNLQKHGFTVSFSSDFKEGRIIQTCTLQHVAGHKRSNQFGARIGKGPPGSSEAQGDGAASTYAKRFALCDALNITIAHDTDARSDGAPITFEQATTLREMVQETRSNEAAFLRFAGAATYDDIGSARYDELFAALNSKRSPR